MLKHETWSWAKTHVWLRAVFLIVPTFVLLVMYRLKPDYRTILVSLAVYLAILLIYGVITLVQIPAKLDKEQKAEIQQRELELATFKTASSNLEKTSTDPFIGLLRERQRLESELQSLLEIEEAGIRVIQTIKCGKDESDYRREKIEHLRRDIAAINGQIDRVQRNQASTLANEWKELADRFATASQFIRADWQHGGMGKNGDQAIETWRFAGLGGERSIEPLCQIAGKMLLRSAKALSRASEQTETGEDDVRRWLYFLKDRGAMTMNSGYGIVQGTNEIILTGSINDVASASKNACLKCAAEES